MTVARPRARVAFSLWRGDETEVAVPAQCPECGRFLSSALVRGLAQGDAACPKCETTLTLRMFEDSPASVRPPDLPPDLVRGEPDVLAGWDQPDNVVEFATRRDSGIRAALAAPPAVLGAAAAGALGGALLGRTLTRKQGLGALVGAAVGAGTALAAARVLGDARAAGLAE